MTQNTFKHCIQRWRQSELWKLWSQGSFLCGLPCSFSVLPTWWWSPACSRCPVLRSPTWQPNCRSLVTGHRGCWASSHTAVWGAVSFCVPLPWRYFHSYEGTFSSCNLPFPFSWRPHPSALDYWNFWPSQRSGFVLPVNKIIALPKSKA